MGKASPAIFWAVFVVGLGLAVGSGWTTFREFMPLLETGTTPQTTVSALVAQPVKPGLSYRSKLLVLNSCNAALNSVEGATLASDRRAQLLGHCDEIAAGIVEEAPTFSYAWYVRAASAAARDDAALFNQALVQSQITAPNQGWLARSRADLARLHLADLTVEASEALDQDIAVLAQSRSRANWLATSYLQSEEFGERIAQVIETLDTATQRRFLSNVRRVNQTRNGVTQ